MLAMKTGRHAGPGQGPRRISDGNWLNFSPVPPDQASKVDWLNNKKWCGLPNVLTPNPCSPCTTAPATYICYLDTAKNQELEMLRVDFEYVLGQLRATKHWFYLTSKYK